MLRTSPVHLQAKSTRGSICLRNASKILVQRNVRVSSTRNPDPDTTSNTTSSSYLDDILRDIAQQPGVRVVLPAEAEEEEDTWDDVMEDLEDPWMAAPAGIDPGDLPAISALLPVPEPAPPGTPSLGSAYNSDVVQPLDWQQVQDLQAAGGAPGRGGLSPRTLCAAGCAQPCGVSRRAPARLKLFPPRLPT
mmetsp:Transcript_11491/g.24653  ORF Transcript_11491/g.24653 Transcript_11491/m.24653 type:complete len:191 (-) Transcript_11491:356-928(-)